MVQIFWDSRKNLFWRHIYVPTDEYETPEIIEFFWLHISARTDGYETLFWVVRLRLLILKKLFLLFHQNKLYFIKSKLKNTQPRPIPGVIIK